MFQRLLWSQNPGLCISASFLQLTGFGYPSKSSVVKKKGMPPSSGESQRRLAMALHSTASGFTKSPCRLKAGGPSSLGLSSPSP